MVRTALGQSIPRQSELIRSSSGEGVAKLRLPICITMSTYLEDLLLEWGAATRTLDASSSSGI